MNEVELCEIVKKTNMFPRFSLHEEVGMDINGNSCDMVYHKDDEVYCIEAKLNFNFEVVASGDKMGEEGERDKCYASFVRFIKNGIVIEGSKPIMDELESLSHWSKHDAEAILKRPSKDIQDKIGSILFTSTKKAE